MDSYDFGERDIFVLRLQKNLPIRVTGEYLVGALGSVNWECLETTAAQIIRAITSVLELPKEALLVEEFFGLVVPNSPVGLVISAAPNKEGDLVLEQVDLIRAFMLRYLRLLVDGLPKGQGELLINEISCANPSVSERLNEVVHADLAVVGGKPIRTPMLLGSGSATLLLEGAYAAKPAVPRKSPERIEFIGRIVGLNSIHKRASVFNAADGEIEFDCDPNRFASQIRNAIHTTRYFVIGVMRNFDGKGREQLVLTDVLEIEPPSPAPDSLV